MKITYYTNKLNEIIKYDFNNLKLPLVMVVELLVWLLILFKKDSKAFKITSSIFRSGWSGSFNFGLRISKYFYNNPNKMVNLQKTMIEKIEVLERTKKFFDDPTEMLGEIIIVLKSPNNNEKGALLLNYSYYFPLFMKFYDVNEISKKYNIILEPSWAGFCELEILSYGLLENAVYLMCYEGRDRSFIDELDESFIPLPIGPSWFINHQDFIAKKTERDIDLIMVAGWAKFKRHYDFFKQIKKLIKTIPNLNIVLVGYPVDMTQDEIKDQANYYGVLDNIQIYEWIPPQEVASLLMRSKLNVLWSKFEGNNRAIIEGMFCDTPVILLDGHNYGEHYDFINNQTGSFANEKNFISTVTTIMNNLNQYTPRNYVMKNRNCIVATEIMNDILHTEETKQGREWNTNLCVKVNELNGMKYFNTEDNDKFNKDYQELTQYLIN